MSENNAVVVAQPQKKASNKITWVGLATAITVGMLPAISQAAEISTLGAGLSEEIDGSKALIITIFGAGAVVLGIFAGYRYLKRGANSA